MCTREEINHFTKCFSAMTDPILFVARNVRKSFLEAGKKENRIVTKAALTAWRFQDFSLCRLRKNSACFAPIRERDDAHEPGATLFVFLAAHRIQQFAYP